MKRWRVTTYQGRPTGSLGPEIHRQEFWFRRSAERYRDQTQTAIPNRVTPLYWVIVSRIDPYR